MQAEGDVIRFPAAEERAPRDFAEFFAEEHRGLFKALYFVTGNRADAAELMQDAFLKLWERWDRMERIDDPTGYLFRVALNGSGCGRAPQTGLRGGWCRSPRPPTRSTRSASGKTSVPCCSGCRRANAPPLVLLDMYGYGSEEAARIIGIRPSTVRALATQGRAVLRKGSPHA